MKIETKQTGYPAVKITLGTKSAAEARRLAEAVSLPQLGAAVRANQARAANLQQIEALQAAYEVRIWYSAEPGDECFVAQVLDMPGIMAHGDTREEAAREIQLALELALRTYAEAGELPPVPKNHAAVALGSRGGSARSKAKRLAAKRNGARGGRPRTKSRTLAA